MRKNVFFLVLSLSFLVAHARADQVCLKDGKGMKCLNVQQGTTPAVNAGKINALLRQATTKLRTELENAGVGDRKRVGDALDKLDKTVSEIQNIQGALKQLERDAKAGKADGAAALEKLTELQKALGLLGDELKANRRVILRIWRDVGRIDARQVKLDVAAYGHAVWNYGLGSGLLLSFSLPMGDDALWTARLSGGLGIATNLDTDNLGVGWVATTSLTRKMDIFSIGPAIVGMGNEGGLLDGSQGWIFGGGAELRMKFGRGFVSATPFLGVAMTRDQRGVWHPPAYKRTPCGEVEIRGSWYEPREVEKRLRLGGGALISIGATLF